MQIHILEEIRPELAAIDGAPRRRELEIRRAQSVEPIDRPYTFAGWTLDGTTRDLMSPVGQRVDLTSSSAPPRPATVARGPSRRVARAPVDIFRSFDRHAGCATSEET
jgi:hypothetical protein